MPNGMSHDSQIFTSWKEIASYLGKGVRTVQRWEAQFGLPVQRPNARTKGIVRASREDLDKWISTRWSSRSLRVEIPLTPKRPNPDAMPVALSGVDRTHHLRTENRRLLNELEKSLLTLNARCRDLVTNLETIVKLRAENDLYKASDNRTQRPV